MRARNGLSLRATCGALALTTWVGCTGGAAIVGVDSGAGRPDDVGVPNDLVALTDAPAHQGDVAAVLEDDAPKFVDEKVYYDESFDIPHDECVATCTANPDFMAIHYCGTDHHAYTACQVDCGDVPDEVDLYPGDCMADGTPTPGAPRADMEDVCDYIRVGTEWHPVQCPSALTTDPLEGIEIRSPGAPSQGTMPGTMSPEAPAPALPALVDHRPRFVGTDGVSVVKNQGSLGACTAFASTGALEGAVAASTGAYTRLSETHMWLRYCVPDHGDAADSLTRGIATDFAATAAGFPYSDCGEDDSDCTSLQASCFRAVRDGRACRRALRLPDGGAPGTPPDASMSCDPGMGPITNLRPAAAIAAAQRLDTEVAFEAGSVVRYDVNPVTRRPDPSALMQALANGADVVMSFRLTRGGWSSPDGVVRDTGVTSGAHAVLLVGYMMRATPSGDRCRAPEARVGGATVPVDAGPLRLSDGGSASPCDIYFIFRNSWGTSFGDRGYGYISAAYMNRYGLGPAWSVTARCDSGACRGTAGMACPTGQIRSDVDGTCRQICSGGNGVAAANGTCPATACSDPNTVNDASGACVRACRARADNEDLDFPMYPSTVCTRTHCVYRWVNRYQFRRSGTPVWTCNAPPAADGGTSTCSLTCAAPSCGIYYTSDGPVCVSTG